MECLWHTVVFDCTISLTLFSLLFLYVTIGVWYDIGICLGNEGTSVSSGGFRV